MNSSGEVLRRRLIAAVTRSCREKEPRECGIFCKFFKRKRARSALTETVVDQLVVVVVVVVIFIGGRQTTPPCP
jgi:hypothetical protein